jgi:hypothetical protein
MKIYVLRDRQNPDRFGLAWASTKSPRPTILPWREARLNLDPEVFACACRVSFGLWCERHSM